MPWLGDDLAAFFATLCGEVDGDATVLITTRYRPAETPGSWTEIGPCPAGEILRMTAWWPALARLPASLRRHLARKRLEGHPRAVRWVEELVREAEEAWIARGGRRLDVTEDMDTAWREVLEPALQGLPEKIEADLALGAVVERLKPGVRRLLGDCTAIGLPVPWQVVERLGEGGAVLRDRGLLTRFGVDEDAWAVHPFVRRTLERRASGELWSQEARSVLGDFWSERGEVSGQVAELREALTHLVAAERWGDAGGLLSRISDDYRRRGWVRARLEFVQAYAETPWPDRERDVWLYHLGDAANAMGHYELAERALRSSVEVAERVYGTREHAEVAASLHGLANVLTNQGRYQDAEQAYRESIEIQQRVYGTREHAGVATSLSGLANVLTRQGRYPDAEQAYRDSIEIQQRVYGTREHAEVATSLSGLANVLTFQGRYPDAEQAYRDSIEIQQRVFGTREHASVATSLHGLANVLTSQGRYPDAEEAYRESIEIKQRVYGTREHAEVAVSLHGLANVLTDQGRYADAEQAYRDSIDIQERVYGTRVVPALLPPLTNLASMLLGQDRDAEALTFLREAWETALTLGSAIDAVQVGVVLVRVLLKEGEREVAEERAGEVRELLQAFPEDHPVRRSVVAGLEELLG